MERKEKHLPSKEYREGLTPHPTLHPVSFRYGLGHMAYQCMCGCTAHPYVDATQMKEVWELPDELQDSRLAALIAAAPGVRWPAPPFTFSPALVKLVEGLLSRVQSTRAGIEEVSERARFCHMLAYHTSACYFLPLNPVYN